MYQQTIRRTTWGSPREWRWWWLWSWVLSSFEIEIVAAVVLIGSEHSKTKVSPTSSINTNTTPIIGIVRLFSNASSLRPCLHLQKIGCEKAFYFPIMICWVPRDAYSSSQFPILHHFYPCHHHQPQGSHPHHHHCDLFSRQGSHILLSYSPGCTSLTLSDAYYLALIPTFIYATKNALYPL